MCRQQLEVPVRLRRRVLVHDGADDRVATHQRLDLRRQRTVRRGTEVDLGPPGWDPHRDAGLVVGAPHLVEAEPTVERVTEDLAAGSQEDVVVGMEPPHHRIVDECTHRRHPCAQRIVGGRLADQHPATVPIGRDPRRTIRW